MKYFEKISGKAESVVEAGVGARVLDKTIRSGKLTGRETLYHTTSVDNIENIKKRGIRSTFSKDPNNLTNTVLKHISDDEKKGKTYLARKRRIGVTYRTQGELTGNKKKTVKLKVPLNTLKEIDNPELMGSKTKKEYLKKNYVVTKKNATQMGLPEPPEKLVNFVSSSNYKSVSRKGTATVQGSVSPRYIKGSKYYKPGTLKEFSKYVKSNPKTFAKGLVGATAGVGLLGLSINRWSK